MNGYRPVTDEPARGTVLPPWVFSLPGLERVRLLSRRVVPATPYARLVGFRIGHVSTGAVTGTMRAGGHLLMVPDYNIGPLYSEALVSCGSTAIDAGMTLEPVTFSSQMFRRPRPQPGNFLGRARVLNASSVFVSCAAELEDPMGRLVGFATSQWAVRPVDPPPPAPPASLEPIGEPTYPTPDPADRPTVGGLPSAEALRRYSGLELARMIIADELPPLPNLNTFGARWVSADEGLSHLTMPASEWFTSLDRSVSPGAIDSFLSCAGAAAAVTMWAPGQTMALLQLTTRFLRSAPADGREVTARGKVRNRVGNQLFLESEVIDADGNTLAVQIAAAALIDPRERRSGEPERVLATLLFTDIVGSTQRAERMGDAAWRSLLDEHHELVRQELGAHRGREVNTSGDGFLARFDSPAMAIRCARAIRDGMKRLQLEIRAGIHTGEVEVHGTDLAGIAVHVAARILSFAEPNEIVVSQTVRDLAAGSGARFATRGRQALKGVEGEWELFVLDD
ncbi:MAG TPA: adenylate/guanylate cyclase domain-containing protein [Actinomycetota bacterium]|nr:adenylate/guanylate cyclase domain-containing protein [Actinomycetota bacterium]